MIDPIDRLPSNRTRLGRLLRLPLRLLPRGRALSIPAGPLAGMKWVIGSGPHSIFLGFNEIAKRRRFLDAVRSGTVVYDVGAHVGSYTMMASRACGERGHVVAFEPLPENLDYLRRHIALNQLENVTVIPAALSDRAGRFPFDATDDRVNSRLTSSGTITVDCCTIDGLIEDARIPPPDCIKLDVEGEEAAVLRGAERLLRSTNQPLVFVATHGDAVLAECMAILTGAGYAIEFIAGMPDELVASPIAGPRPH